MQKLIFTNEVARELSGLIAAANPHGVYVLADSNTAMLVWPYLAADCPALSDARLITVPAGDINKNLDSLSHIWSELQKLGANRHSMLINVGGGMITDIGGFAASTFKRGMRFINVPTTLLGAVDASVGGKTGINFGGLKNEIGAFREAEAVVISTAMFSSLPDSEMYSGYAEMIKHGLLDGEEALTALLAYNPCVHDLNCMLELLESSVGVKRRVVAEDPTEKGLRKSLNLGHTAGHAFESLAMEKGAPVPHGYAVAWGIVVELVLSHMHKGFSTALLRKIAGYVRDHYGVPSITCDDYPRLLELMHHDKKNLDDRINFTMLEAPGVVAIDSIAGEEDIKVALDIFRDLMSM